MKLCLLYPPARRAGGVCAGSGAVEAPDPASDHQLPLEGNE